MWAAVLILTGGPGRVVKGCGCSMPFNYELFNRGILIVPVHHLGFSFGMNEIENIYDGIGLQP